MTTLTGRGLGTFSGTARGYTPAEPSKWSPVPDRVAEALDIIAGGGGAIALANAFVWQPGGPTSAPGLYNSTSFGPVAAAMSLVPGPKTLGIDTTYGVATIAGGPYELPDVTMVGALLTGVVTVTFAAGAKISTDTTNLHFEQCQVVVDATTGAVWSPAEALAFLTLNSSTLTATAAGAFVDAAHDLSILVENASRVGDGAHAVVVVESTGTVAMLVTTGSAVASDAFAQGTASGGAIDLQVDGSSGVSPVQGAGPVYQTSILDPTPTFIYAPGATGVLNANVYTDPTLLREALNQQPGAPRTVLIDDRNAAAHFTGAGWDLDNVTLTTVYNSSAQLLLDAGMTFTASHLKIEGALEVIGSPGAGAPNWTVAGFALLEMGFGTILQSTTTQAVISATATGLTIAGSSSNFGDGTHPILTVAAGQSASVFAYDNTSTAADSFAGLGTVAFNYDASSAPNATQTVTTFTQTADDGAGAVSFTPATGGNWNPVPAFVAAALNQLAAPNEVEAANNTGTGSGTSSAVTGNLAKKRSGKVRVWGLATGITTSATTTVTVSIIRDAGTGGATTIKSLPAITCISTVGYTIPISVIDTLPDTANHTYTVQAVAGAGNLTVGANGNEIQAVEL